MFKLNILFKNGFRSFFSFTKREYNGLLVFVLLILLVQFSPAIYSFFKKEEKTDFTQFEKEIEAFEASAKTNNTHKYSSTPHPDSKHESVRYFDFDPNTLEPDGWKKLGLSAKQVHVINNYVSKGGRFYKPEDLKKIYSISLEDYTGLLPYIKIAPRQNSYTSTKTPFFAPKKEKAIVELNTADSAQLETLPGIGAAFASRIIKYRNRLGGFYDKEQLKEVYGLDSAKYVKLEDQVSVNPASVTTININTATFDDLKKQPYLSYKQMNALLQYRKQHGFFKSPEDLKKILIINDLTLKKITPYLSF